MSAFDETDWPPIRVLAWVWLRDPSVVDDPELNTLRLAIHGARRDAPIEMPAPDPMEPAGLYLAPVSSTPNPELGTLHVAEQEIHTASRAGRLRWSGRRPDTGLREKIPTLNFVDAEIEYDDGQLVQTGGRDREELRQGRVLWHGLRAKRNRVVRKLWPQSPAVVPVPAAQPVPPPATKRPATQEVGLAKDFLRHCARTGERPQINIFAEKIRRNWRTAKNRLKEADSKYTAPRGNPHGQAGSTWKPSSPSSKSAPEDNSESGS